MTNHYGSIEAGGTKFVLAIGDEQFNILKTNQIPTTSPEETITRTIEFFKENPVKSLAVGSFGPIDIKPESATYGYITTTPKAGWANVDLLGKLKAALDIPMVFTTDVNSSAYGEMIVTGGNHWFISQLEQELVEEPYKMGNLLEDFLMQKWVINM